MKRSDPKLSSQMKRRQAKPKKKSTRKRNAVISTGSTLLDLAISGGRYEAGGLPGGILVEIFGPSGTAKTVLLSEIAGTVQHTSGEVEFYDPEGRLNKQFARLFGLDVGSIHYKMPGTVTELFRPLRNWKPKGKGPHGVFADSLAALTTEMSEEGKDQYGMRRAKEFSEELRHVCRALVERNILMVCSNQVRQNFNAGPYGPKYKSPGGEAIGFYSSVRLRTMLSAKGKIKKKRKIHGKEHQAVTGVNIEVEVFKNSVWAPYRKAPVIVQFDYGIDDVKANLQYLKENKYLKTNKRAKGYKLNGQELAGNSDVAARLVEDEGLEDKLKQEVIELWREIEEAFSTNRRRRR